MQKLPSPRLLVNLPCTTGEGPLWHPDEQKIYWTDIPSAKLYRCRADGRELESFTLPGQVGGFTLQADGSLLLFMDQGAVRNWRDGQFTGTVIASLPGELDSRFNDVIADPVGRVYCGTMASRQHGGRFYQLNVDRSIDLIQDKMQTPNGMGFSPDFQFFYQNDSRACCTYRFRYNQKNGELSRREIIFSTSDSGEEGRPDGLTVDHEGCIWTGRWDGHRVVRHQPDGTPFAEIIFPVKKVSSLTIAGPDLRTAFFTSAGGNRRNRDEGELAGSLFFHPAMPCPGIPECRSRIRV